MQKQHWKNKIDATINAQNAANVERIPYYVFEARLDGLDGVFYGFADRKQSASDTEILPE